LPHLRKPSRGIEQENNMFAVIKTGGKQYRVAANDQITIEKLVGSAGETVAFEHVLMLTDGDVVHVGAPTVDGVSVAAEIIEQGRGDKVISFKKRRRQNSKRKRGHRQDLTVVRITDILTGGKKVTVTAKAPVVAAAALAVSAAIAPKAAKSTPAAAMDASNLSLISGIGPTIEKKLRAAGIQSWNEIAAWSQDDLAKWDEQLALRGRATREEWVEQAKELLAGKPPRAKADQAELKSGKDL
jgi:large subunit ribosomal protein L21